jgi:transcription initiation factor TFIIIB Brf1 subunit/transcription initiation factor TFIIB
MQSVIQCETCDPSESKMITDVESGEIICNQCGIVVVQDLEDTKIYGTKPKIVQVTQGMEIHLL